MNTLRENIDRGLAIIAQIELLQAEYKEIEAAIKSAALERPAEHVALEDPEREGRQFLAAGSDLVVPVVMTADSIMKSFQKGSPAHLKIAALAGDRLAEFYVEPSAYEAVLDDGKLFRARAREVFGEAKGPHFVAACLARKANGTPKSAIKIEWKRAAAAAKMEEVSRG